MYVELNKHLSKIKNPVSRRLRPTALAVLYYINAWT